MELPMSLAAETGLGGSLVGPLAMMNAACKGCANVKFSQFHRKGGVLCMRAVQLRRIRRGEELCASYGLAFEGGRCVACGRGLPRSAQGQGGHTWETPPQGWAAVHRRYGKTYWVHVGSGKACWPEAVRA